MNNWRKFSVTKEELEKSYVKLHNIKKVGAELGYGPTTILRWLKKYGIKTPPRGSAFKDLSGKRFGRLLVLEKDNSRRTHWEKIKWKCKCDCGKEKIISGESLKFGLTTSCGCYQKSLFWKGYKDISGTYWRSVCVGAKSRKLEFNITLQDIWEQYEKQNRRCALSGLEIFIYPKYTDFRKYQTASLDRIDGKKGYTKDNIQWVHKEINRMKGKLQDKDFIKFCCDVSNFTDE
jgi:hypothetical protein